MTTTYAELLGQHEIEVPAHLVGDAEVPVITGMQRQGDVFVLPTRAGKVAGLEPIPPQGLAVVRSESGGNTHLLVAEGAVSYAPRNTRADLGTLVVDKGTAWLLHPEHGAQGIGKGTYLIRRQVEQADEIRIVAD